MKKKEKKRKKVEIHVGMCRYSVHLYLRFMTCRYSKYLESLGFSRSRFDFYGRTDFLNDFKDMQQESGLFADLMV